MTTTSRPTHDDTDIFDASDMANGLYEHPSDDTRYIQVHNGRAADIPCPDCPQCERGYMRFNLKTETSEHTH